MSLSAAHRAELREFAEELLSFRTIDGREAAAFDWLLDRLSSFGFTTYDWTADAEELAPHQSFPDDPAEIPVENRPSVAGVLEFGDPDHGPTLVLNGHYDVVPAEDESWTCPPFEPTWDGDDLVARGAADMKVGLSAAVFAARHVAEQSPDVDGRIVVECVAGEENGGIGTASAILSNPYPFERDAAIVAEPTRLRPVVATAGSLMMRLTLRGRSSHAATRWRGESVLPHFERIRRAFEDLERERTERADHPLYEEYPVPWPVTVGRVTAGSWASSVPAELQAEIRIGIALDETADETEAVFRERLDEVVADSEWLREHPPEFERFSVQFEPAATDPDEPVARAVREVLRNDGRDDSPRGATYGADSRHFVAAGIPTVLFGPGTVENAHYPDESIHWPDAVQGTALLAEAARTYLAD